MAKKKSGGAREGAGAPLSQDPKIFFSIGVRESVMNKIGGITKAKKLAPDLLTQHANRN